MHCISLGRTLKVIVKRQFIAKMRPEFIYLKCRDKALLFMLKGKNVLVSDSSAHFIFCRILYPLFLGCCYITVDFATVASQNSVYKTEQMCQLI